MCVNTSLKHKIKKPNTEKAKINVPNFGHNYAVLSLISVDDKERLAVD
jgi:hypothetical protein